MHQNAYDLITSKLRLLTRIMEKTVVHFIYPTFHQKSPTSLTFRNQFPVRLTGSTTIATTTLVHKHLDYLNNTNSNL